MKRLGLIRLVLLAVVGATLLSCGTDVRDGGDPTPQEVTDEMVVVGRDVLPALSDALGVPAPNPPMVFTERSGFGIYDYTGRGTFLDVDGTPRGIRARLEQAVLDGGMTTEDATSLEDVRARRGNVMVRLSVRGDGPRDVEFSISTIETFSADEEDVPSEPTGLMDLIEQ